MTFGLKKHGLGEGSMNKKPPFILKRILATQTLTSSLVVNVGKMLPLLYFTRISLGQAGSEFSVLR